MSQTEYQSLEDNQISDNSEVMLWRYMVFSTALYCQNQESQTNQGEIPSRFQKNRSAQAQQVNITLAPKKGILPSKEFQHWLEGREAFNLYF